MKNQDQHWFNWLVFLLKKFGQKTKIFGYCQECEVIIIDETMGYGERLAPYLSNIWLKYDYWLVHN